MSRDIVLYYISSKKRTMLYVTQYFIALMIQYKLIRLTKSGLRSDIR